MDNKEKIVAKPRKRIFYLDFIRAIATVAIVLTHFNNPYLSNSGYLLTNYPFGIYLGNAGVSLFLIISGASLALTYRYPLNYKKFYWKRFIGIYPMFWTAWVLATMYLFLARDGHVLSNAPISNLIFTVFGVDGLAANFHINTFYLLGEWFLGFILLFYLIFPLLLWAINRFPISTAAVILGLYILSVWYLQGSGLPAAMIISVRLPELVFGMYFMIYWKKFPKLLLIPAAGILVLASFFPDFNENIATTAVGISLFIILVIAGTLLDHQIVRAPFNLISKYSYGIFLVHHVIIMEVYRVLNTSTFEVKRYYFLFATVCVLSFIFAVVLSKVTASIVDFCKNWISA